MIRRSPASSFLPCGHARICEGCATTSQESKTLINHAHTVERMSPLIALRELSWQVSN